MGKVEGQGPEGAEMLTEVIPTIYLEGKKNASNKSLEFPSLKTPFSLGLYHSAPWVQKVCRGKRLRGGTPIPLLTAASSGQIPALSGEDWNWGLTTDRSRESPSPWAGGAHEARQGQECPSHMLCPNRNPQTQCSISLQIINIIAGAAS